MKGDLSHIVSFELNNNIHNDLQPHLNYNKMEETEQYLNKILQKRLGSVINQSAFTKQGSTVTRLPRQEEKIESMPTVFRKKHETIYNSNEEQSRRTSSLTVHQP